MPSHHPRTRTVLALALGIGSAPLLAQQATGTLGVTIVSIEGSIPLQNARVVLDTQRREGLTNIDGHLVFGDLSAGRTRLRVLRIGYVPLDTLVDLSGRGRVDIRLQLHHLTVTLEAVRVIEYPPCRNPGLAQGARDTVLTRLIEQLRLNAEQYRYLIHARPFEYVALRVAGKIYEQSGTRADSVDTITVRSDQKGWRYQPGRLLEADRGVNRRLEQAMHLPTLSDFASDEFLDNHCFYFAGVERSLGEITLARIDFRAAERLRAPDVDGSIWLDPSTFSIRRAELELSKIPKDLRGIAGVRVTTTFAEVLEAVPIFENVEGVTTLKPYPAKDPVSAFLESQRLIRVVFANGTPQGGNDPTPAARAATLLTRARASPRSS